MRLGWLFLWLVSFCAQALTVTVEDTEIPVQVISPQKDPPVARLLWLPSEYGRLLQEESIARRLTQQGVESWLPELFESLIFFPLRLPVCGTFLPRR